jgi:hypothetical protein
MPFRFGCRCLPIRDMLADCFTKVVEPTQLMSVLESGFLRHEIKQWILRDV